MGREEWVLARSLAYKQHGAEGRRHAHLGHLVRKTVDHSVASETACRNGEQEKAVSGMALAKLSTAEPSSAEVYRFARAMQRPPDLQGASVQALQMIYCWTSVTGRVKRSNRFRID